jgi:hypothetical protein
VPADSPKTVPAQAQLKQQNAAKTGQRNGQQHDHGFAQQTAAVLRQRSNMV